MKIIGRMKKYDFDTVIPRRGTNSYKWDTAPEEGVLPMWVADMDFKTAPAVIEALKKRAEHGVFGYTKIPQRYYDAVSNWFTQRHGVDYETGWILPTTGVLPALAAILRALTMPGDGVVMQTPAYNCFFSSLNNAGCKIIENELVYSNGKYSIDFDDFEKKTALPNAKVFLLCSPHNPSGRVWTKEELVRMGEICQKNNVFVISDEIHCDIVFEGRKHIPFASLGNGFLQNSATCVSPSKTFNLAGVQCANIVCANAETREKISKALNVNEVAEISPFAVDALVAAYNEGGAWLEELLKYMGGNFTLLKEFFAENFPKFKVLPLEATYLVWVDCSALGMPSEKIEKILYEKEGLWVNEGTKYGSAGEGFLRINIACPKSLLIEGLEKIKNAFCTDAAG